MSTFKVGDKVRFLGNHKYIIDYPEDKKYAGQVGVAVDSTPYTVRVEMADGYLVRGWGMEQFELVQEEPKSLFRVTGGNYIKAFDTLSEAVTHIETDAVAGHTYAIDEIILRRRFEVIEKTTREIVAK